MMDDSQIHRLMTQSGCGGTLTPAVRRFAQACYAAGVAAERELWERTLGAEMPADFKCWHQNAASERPEVAAWVIRNLREHETLAWRDALAWSEGQRAALDCRTCHPGPTAMSQPVRNADELPAAGTPVDLLCGRVRSEKE